MSAIALFGGAPTLTANAHRTWPILGEDVRAAVLRVLDRGVLSGPSAPEATAFEDEFAAYVGAKHALLTHSGTSALHLALVAAKVGPGDEVIVPAYSFVATPLAVMHAGAKPVFVDVDADTGLMDPEAARAAVTERTRAIMPVHVHGCPADLDALSKLGPAVVEDAAQAHGATYGGRPVGAIGVAGGFSLQSSKNLGAGEGGVFVTNDAEAAAEADRVRNFGLDMDFADRRAFDPARPLDGSRALVSRRVGFMYRGNELTAAVARAQLARLPERTERCRANAERLGRALAELPGVLPQRPIPGRASVHHKFRVRLDPAAAGLDVAPRVLRDAMIAALRAEGLEVVLWQTTPLPAHPLFGRDPSAFPNTCRLLDGSLLLFSQSAPLIAQDEALVDRYADAFARVWRERAAVVARAR